MKKITDYFKKKGPNTAEGESNAEQLKPGYFKVQSGKELLSAQHRVHILNKIHSLISLPDKHYNALVTELLENFAEFVQQLPATEKNHHSVPGGLLNHSLQVALTALLIRRGFMLPIGAPPEVVAKKQEIWTYAILTAGLLRHVAPALINLSIKLYDDKFKPQKEWQILEDSMIDFDCYDVAFVDRHDTGIAGRINLLIAKQLLPVDGLNWLYSDRDIMSQWLAAISGDMVASGIIGQIVERANKQNIQDDLAGNPPAARVEAVQETKAKPGVATKPQATTTKAATAAPELETSLPPNDTQETPAALSIEPQLMDVMPEELEGETAEEEQDEILALYAGEEIPSDLGEFFVFWLKRVIAAKKIEFNQEDSIHVVDEGVFLVCPGIFQRFLDENPEIDAVASTVQNRFQKLKIHKKSAGTNMYNYASYDQGKRVVHRGYVIENTESVLMEGTELPDVNKKLELDFI